ncbi:MAG: response regulator, partial [Dechloromonas sp.]|nr:response regulator [Dechloromonas sp.]
RKHPDYDVEVANSGTEALKLVSERRERNYPPFVLTITDLNMPGMSGVDLVRNLHGLADYTNGTFIVLTASEGEDTTRQCLEAGASAVISKRSICDRPKQRILELVESFAPIPASGGAQPEPAGKAA